MNLTNEKLARRFKNQFDLVNYAIKLAENMIKSGRDTRIKTDVKNRAYQILQEISIGVDRFDDVIASEHRHAVASAVVMDTPVSKHVYDTPSAAIDDDEE